MKTYPEIRNILHSLFSVETGIDDEAAQRAFQRALDSDPRLKSELHQLFSDEGVNWRELLCNDEYEVYDAESDIEARAFAYKLLKEDQPA